MEIPRTGADFWVQARHCFKIVIEHVWTRFDHFFQYGWITFQEIRRENFNRCAGAAMTHGTDGLCEMFCTAIVQIITVHRGDHNVV